MSSDYFEINENRENGCLTLSLTGELDMRSAPMLTHRLNELLTENVAVRLDLARLEFIDSSGIHVLVQAFREARMKNQELELGEPPGGQVRHVFRLVQLDRLIGQPVASLQRSAPLSQRS